MAERTRLIRNLNFLRNYTVDNAAAPAHPVAKNALVGVPANCDGLPIEMSVLRVRTGAPTFRAYALVLAVANRAGWNVEVLSTLRLALSRRRVKATL